MATIAELVVKINGSNAGLRKELEASKRQLSRFQRDIPDLLPDNTGSLLLGLGAGLGAAGVGAVKLASGMETNRIAFETMLGSAEQSKAMLDNLASFAEKTPFEFDDLIRSSKRMLGLGIAAEEILPQLQTVGDAIAAVGGTSEAVGNVTDAMAKMQSAGFISAEQMNRLTDAGIPGWQMLSKVLTDAAGRTVTVGEAMKLAETRGIDATTAIQGMMAEMANRYGGAMNRMSSTNTGIWSNIHDTAIGVLRDIGEGLNDSLEIKEHLNGILGDLEEFKANVKAVGVGQAMIDELPVNTLAVGVGLFSAAIMTRAIPALAALRVSIQALGLASGPVGWLIVGTGALAGLLFDLGLRAQQTGQQVEQMNAVVYEGIDRMYLAGDAAGNLAGKMDGVYSSAVQAARGMEIYNAVTGDIAGGGKSHIPYGTPNAPPPPPAPPPLVIPEPKSTGVDEAKKKYDELVEKAERASRSIEEEWVRTTKSELEQLDFRRDREKTELDDLAEVSATYEEDKRKLTETYSKKRADILRREAQEALETFKTIRDGYASILKETTLGGLVGSIKDMANIGFDLVDKIKSTRNYFDEINKNYASGDDRQKKDILQTLDSLGIAYQKADQDRLDFSKATEDAITRYKNNAAREVTDYYATCKDIQADIDAAYSANSMVALQAALTQENAIRQSNYEAQKQMMDLYQQAMADSTLTWAETMSRTTSAAYDGLKNGLEDIFNGTKSIGDAWETLGETVRNAIAKMAAEWLAGRLAMAMFGKQSGDDQATQSAAQGAATAAAWWPAAIAVSLATFGANAGPAIGGMSMATVAGMALGAVSGYAEGGAVFGPGTGTSDSILAKLSHGEFVFTANATDFWGVDTLEAMNQGRMPAFAEGGLVTGPSLSSISSNYNRSPYQNSDIEQTKSKDSGRTVEIHLHALDGQSTEHWLDNGGGKKLLRYINQESDSYRLGV